MLREIINFSKLWCYFVKLGVRNCIYKSCNLYCDYKCLNVVVKFEIDFEVLKYIIVIWLIWN